MVVTHGGPVAQNTLYYGTLYPGDTRPKRGRLVTSSQHNLESQNTTAQTPIPRMAERPNTPPNSPPLAELGLDGRLELAEDAAMYITGGYHPVEIGDELHHGRYRIIHRLGHGGYATVWLALNQHYSLPNAPHLRYVAIKIATADSKKDEAAILRRFSQPSQPQPTGWFHWLRSLNFSSADAQHEQSSFIVSLLDEFEINGPNGFHRCIVTEVLGPSVSAVTACCSAEVRNAVPMMGRRLAVQAAKAIAFLHSHGIVHAGRFKFPTFAEAIVDSRYRFSYLQSAIRTVS